MNDGVAGILGSPLEQDLVLDHVSETYTVDRIESRNLA